VEEPSDRSISKPSSSASPLTGEGVVIDIGTGDGLFVYQSAKENPGRFYIGIDANRQPLEKISEKIHRKPASGGLPNVLFLQAAVEDLPPELDGVADEVHVHFPWGTLLRAVATGDSAVLASLRRICAPGALLEVVIGIDPERDHAEIERLGLQSLSLSLLASKYEAAGFNVLESGALAASDWSTLRTSWAKRLKSGANRTVFYIVAQHVK